MAPICRISFLVFAACWMASSANAVPITWTFGGTVDSSAALGSGAATTATTFTGSLSFESTTPDAQPGNTAEGWYDAGALTATLQIGSDTIALDLTTFRVLDDAFVVSLTLDGFAATAGSGSINGVPGNAQFILQVGTTDLSFWSSDAIPASPPGIGPLGVQGLLLATLIDGSGNGYNISGTLTTVALPEPATGWLLGATLLAGALYRRRGD